MAIEVLVVGHESIKSLGHDPARSADVSPAAAPYRRSPSGSSIASPGP